MQRRSLWCSCLLLLPLAGCTKGSGLIDNFGTYGGGGVGESGEGDDEGDEGDEDDEGDEGDDEGGPGGPVDDGAEDPATDGGDEAPPPPGEGDCCMGHDAPGCGDPAIADCVCAQDPFCCESVWDDLCASLVVDNGCGVCEAGEAGGGTDGGGEAGEAGGVEEGGGEAGEAGGVEEGGVEDGGVEEGGGGEVGGDGGTCCMAHPGTGCDDPAIEACVCGQDDYCCATEWDDICVSEVDSFGCGSCGGGGEEGGVEEGGVEEGGGETGGGGEGGGGGDCCDVSATPGCADPDVEACVCASDDFCCATAWDDLCVSEVDSFGCGVCGGGVEEGGGESGGGASNCCDPHGGLGCTDPDVEACVCGQDDYCCATEWDSLCVDEVTTFGCGVC